MTWIEIISEIAIGMESLGYKRIEGVINIEEDSEVPSTRIHNNYTIRLLEIDKEGIYIANLGGYLVELKVGYITNSNSDYDLTMDKIITLIETIKGNDYFNNFVDFLDNPGIEKNEETFRVVATINLVYGVKAC